MRTNPDRLASRSLMQLIGIGIGFSALIACGEITPELSTIVNYDVTAGEQPVDVFYLSDGRLAVTLPFINEVRVVSAVDGAIHEKFTMPTPVGITEDQQGHLIVTAAPGIFDPNFDPATNAHLHGVSRIDRTTGMITPIAQFPFTVLNPDGTPNPQGTFPRDAVISPDGRIFVSDLAGGRIFVIEPDGSTALWSDHALLRGTEARPGPVGRPPFLTGVNGMRWHQGALYACNTDFGRLLRFELQPDGSAKAPEIIVENPQLLGFDEFEIDGDDIFAILAFRYELVHIAKDGQVTVLLGPEDGIDNPAGLSRGHGDQKDTLFMTNLGFITNNAGEVARPGLLRVDGLFDD